jgi:DNA-directed RNA polymerase specialized sigma24 family protein
MELSKLMRPGQRLAISDLDAQILEGARQRLSSAEIADRIGLPEGFVESRLNQMLRRFRDDQRRIEASLRSSPSDTESLQ